jgi:hypothetical protein
MRAVKRQTSRRFAGGGCGFASKDFLCSDLENYLKVIMRTESFDK